MYNEKIRVLIAFLAILSVSYSIYYFVNKQPSSPPLVLNELQRQELIADVWDYVQDNLKHEKDGHLDKSNKLTLAGTEFVKKSVKERIQQSGKVVDTDQDMAMLEHILSDSLIASYNVLEWCDCTSPDKRIDLVFQIVHDVKKQHPDVTQKLVYVSLGAGDLLQDFVTIAALIKQGYCLLDVIIIDFKYSHAGHRVGITATEESEQVAHTIQAFKQHIAELIAEKSKCSVRIKPLISAYTYIYLVENGREEKGNILVMVDPNRLFSLFKVDTFAEANMVEFSENSLLLVMPEYQKPKIYVPVNSSKKSFEDDIENITRIVHKTTQKNYRSRLKRELAKYTVSYYAEPFVTFQDLIQHAARPSSLVYGLYEKEGKEGAVIDRINSEEYKDADIVTAHVGRDLTSREERNQYKEIAF